MTWQPLGLGDFTGDGRSDIVWKHSPSGFVKLQILSGATVVRETLVDTAFGLTLAAVGDFDGNGRDELLWKAADGTLTMWFINATGDAVTAKTNISQPLTPTQTIVGVGDTGADGKADLIIRDPYPNFDRVWTMSGASITANGTLRQVGTEWDMKLFNDFSNDGRTDIMWRNNQTGENYLYPLDGSTILGGEGFIRTVSDQNWKMIGTGNFDALLGKDILWRNLTLPPVERGYAYTMDGTSITANEGYVDNTALFDSYTLLGIGDFSGLGRKSECLWWNADIGSLKVAGITFNGGHPSSAGQFTMAAGTAIALPTDSGFPPSNRHGRTSTTLSGRRWNV